MTGSQLPHADAQLKHLQSTIERLQALVSIDATALVPDGARQAVDSALVASLGSITDSAELRALLDRFEARADRRPARAADIVITLRLLEQALQSQRAG